MSDPTQAAPFDPREPNMEALIAGAAANGWSFFDPRQPTAAPGAVDPASEKHKRLATIAAALHAVPEFRELLEFVLDASLRRATFVAQLGLPMDQAYGYGVFREGQNSLAQMILKMIAEGRRQAAPPPRES
jgi:hypothetical protein